MIRTEGTMRDEGVLLPGSGDSRIDTSVTTQPDDRPPADGSGSTGPDPEESAYSVSFDATEIPPSVAVVCVVSEVAGEGPLDLEPLYSTVDPDSLDSLISSGPTVEGGVHVTFGFAGYHVTIDSYGRITVRE